MPERQSAGEDIPARLVDRGRGGRDGRAGDQLLRGDGDDDPRVAGRRRRRARDPPDPGRPRRARDPRPRAPRQDVPGDRPARDPRPVVRVGRPTGEAFLVEAADGVRRDRRAGPGGHRGPVRPPAHRRAADPRGVRDLGGLPLGAHRRVAERGAACRPGGRGRPRRSRRPGRASASCPAWLPPGSGPDGRGLRRGRRPRPGPRPGPPPRGGDTSPAAASGGQRARRSLRRLGRPRPAQRQPARREQLDHLGQVLVGALPREDLVADDEEAEVHVARGPGGRAAGSRGGSASAAVLSTPAPPEAAPRRSLSAASR